MAAWAVLAAAGVASGACSAEEPAPSFARDIVPLLKQRCASCHLTGDEPGGMALNPKAAYRSLVGAASQQSPLVRVAPGRVQDSYLMAKLTNRQAEAGGYGDPMPLDGWPLADADIEMVRRWIAAGAPDN
ncbi:MAG: hypothetical protein D6782_10155 [Alphaproteobacteria bacterium]|nr:MAG: hypothetical protein D6782_10155 [Alphaproteobacteria bacterium]